MKGWAASELQFAELGDVRRNKRLVRLVEDLAAQPNASVPQASGDLAATQAAYDFWSSPHIKAEAIRKAHQSSTIERVKQHSIVIAIQDTTELNFTHHPSKKGMGYLDNNSDAIQNVKLAVPPSLYERPPWSCNRRNNIHSLSIWSL